MSLALQPFFLFGHQVILVFHLRDRLIIKGSFVRSLREDMLFNCQGISREITGRPSS